MEEVREEVMDRICGRWWWLKYKVCSTPRSCKQAVIGATAARNPGCNLDVSTWPSAEAVNSKYTVSG